MANQVEKRGSWGDKHITQHSTSNHQPHLTSPCIKLRRSQHTEFKGEGLVLHSQIIQLTLSASQRAELKAEKKTLPLDSRIQMLGKSGREKGELEGVASA
ncbi:hypothetical protein B6K85_06775 [Vibrio sp. V1B]|nr:hypothetical protein B6K85_06775 [Vibrio sp. V1B]